MTTLTPNELTKMSPQFRSFYESLKWFDHEGPEINIPDLLALSGAERELAETILVERIETEGKFIIQALAEMKSQKGAVALKEYVEKVGGTNAVNAALALWRIEQWPNAQSVLIDVLEGRRKYFPEDSPEDFEAMGRAEAARALAYIPNARTREALLRAVDDKHEIVRYWVAIALNVVAKTQYNARPKTD